MYGFNIYQLESVVMRDDAATLVPSAELDEDVLEMYVAKVSWTLNLALVHYLDGFYPKKVYCLLVLENERRRRYRLDARVISQTEWWEGTQYTTAVTARPLC